MSHFLNVPINENGHFLDQRFKEELRSAATDPFAFTDVFLYSHGWGNTGCAEYNIFSLGIAKALQGLVCASPTQWPRMGAAFQPLALPIRGPEIRLEDPEWADSVGRQAGYSLLCLMIERQTQERPYRLNLIGHGFGCRVLCSALQALAEDTETSAKMRGNEFNVALMQAAAESDSLAPGQVYGQVQQGIPNLRMLITTSAADTALRKWYPEPLGSKGPTGDLRIPVDQRLDVTSALVPTFTQRLGVANLTPLHQATEAAFGTDGKSDGQHADINHPPIYDMLARFFGQ